MRSHSLARLVLHKPLSLLIIVSFLSLWLSGCGSLVSVVTATLEPAAQSSGTPFAQNTDSTRALRPSRTPKVPRSNQVRVTHTPRVTHESARTPGGTSLAGTVLPATIDGFRVVTPGDLPPEAQHTLDLIDQGGPFPYRQDGVVFQNREGVLPHKPGGYYHEYTVVTPGSRDRGARRIITGSNSEIYYTEDHYVTFVRVVQP